MSLPSTSVSDTPRGALPWSRVTRRDLRLGSGLVLFAYVTAHLANHALGLISVAAAERGLAVAVAVWHSLPGTIVLYGAALLHVTLAFAAIFKRRTMRMPPLELVRIFLGLGIPMLLIGHAIATRIAWEAYQLSPEYSRIVWALWTSDSEGRQLALLAPGWLHGCLGLHFAFSRRRAYQRWHYVLFGAAVLLPVLAGLGFLAMGKELASRVAEHAALTVAATDPAASLALARLRDGGLFVYLSLVAGVFAAREIRTLIERRRDALVAIAYPGRTVRVPRGWTVLEASRSFHIPHTSMCGGRARCSTCRVRVTSGADMCPPPGQDERATLARINAADGVRLACQLRPRGDIAVVPLLAARAASASRDSTDAPVERNVAVLFVDWRNRAAFGTAHLPQDVVYVSRLFAEIVANAVHAAGGDDGEFSDGGAMAVFGLTEDLSVGCRAALAAADSIERALRDLARRLRDEFHASADFALCLHAGHAAVAYCGPHDARRLLAAGAAVDAVQSMRKAAAGDGAHAVLSLDFARHMGVFGDALSWREIAVPTSESPLRVASLPAMTDLIGRITPAAVA
jgi:adenylate cyclase